MDWGSPVLAGELTTSSGSEESLGSNLAAVGTMLLAVASFGVVPVVIAVGQGNNPFLFGSAMRFGIAVFCLIVLVGSYWPVLKVLAQRESVVFIRGRLLSREMGGILFSYFDFAVLALSLRWAEPSASAVIYEVWPIVLIYIVARWTGGRYRRFDWQSMMMLLIAFVGVIFVLASQSGGFNGLRVMALDEFSSKVYAGFGLALVAAFVTAFTGFSWVWSHNSVHHHGLPEVLREACGGRSLEMMFLLVALVLSNAVALILNGVAGFVFGGLTDEWVTLKGLLLAFVGGGLSYGVASVMWRYATTLTDNLGLHAMSYGTPVFSLVFLAIVNEVGDVVGAYLIIGASTIISANLLINFEGEIRWGFKALLLALGTCGVVVYFLGDDIFSFFGIEAWLG